MYKLLHLLFGWDYIVWTNSLYSGIARVHILPDGTVVYWQYKNLDIICPITNRSDVVWLTCHPRKYGL